MKSSSLHETPSVTSRKPGTSSMSPATNWPNSSGIIVPAASTTVTVVAPASMVLPMTSARKSWSARVASSATSSTSSVRRLQAATAEVSASTIASPFLWWMYSICAGLTAACTCRRGRRASASAAHTSSMFSSSISTGTHRTLFLTMEAIDLMRRLSTFSCVMPSISMTEAPRRSSSFAVSSLSLKVRERSFDLAALRRVTSLMRASFIGTPSCTRDFIDTRAFYRCLQPLHLPCL